MRAVIMSIKSRFAHVIRPGCHFLLRRFSAMPRNVEIKANLSNPTEASSVAKSLSGKEGTVLVQEDTFFTVPQGRLKLRIESDSKAKLIQYNRPDKEGPKLSEFCIAFVEDGESLKIALTRALGVVGIVKKQRLLYLVGQTRVHIDEVEGLGHFLELEVVLKDDQTEHDGQAIAEDLMKKLNVSETDLITNAYIDLLSQKK